MYRLIIADDERIECMVLEHIFQHQMSGQIEVLDSVQDGIALLEAVEEQKPDIAIVDINMPGLGGLDAIELLRMKQIHLKIIIHTAYSEFSYAQRALQLGAVDYLVKPNLKEEIVASVNKVCRMLEAEGEYRQVCVQQEETQQAVQELASGKWIMSLLLEQPDGESYRVVRERFPNASFGGIVTLWRKQSAGDVSGAGNLLGKAAGRMAGGDHLSGDREQEAWREWESRLSSLCSHVSLWHEGKMYCLLFPGNKVKAGDWKAWLSDLIRCMGRGEDEEGLWSFCVGVSGWKEEDAFLAGLHEAQAALWHHSQGGIFFYQDKDMQEDGLLGKIAERQNGYFSAEAAGCLAGYLLEGKEEEGVKELWRRIGQLPVSSYCSSEEKLLAKKISGALFLLAVEEELFFWCREKWLRMSALMDPPAEEENLHIFHTYALVSENYARDLPLEEIDSGAFAGSLMAV